MDIHVSNLEELNAAIANATGGENIVLADGEYGYLTIKNSSFEPGITITSENPQSATFSDIKVSDSSGITFDAIEVEHIKSEDEASFYRAFNISGSDNISVINSDLHGSVDGDYSNDVYMLNVTNCENITVSNNDIHDVGRGGIFTNVTNLVVNSNTVHDIQSDAFDFGAVLEAEITDNSFTNFHPVTGDHPDAIQFWNTGVSTESSGILISGNTMLQGVGDPFQSIFIESDIEDMGYSNFTITDNLIYNDMPNGIKVTDGTGITIENNTLLATPEAEHTPSIIVMRDDGTAIVNNNVATSFIVDTEIQSMENNIIAQYDDPSSDTFYGNLYFNALSGSDATTEDFTPIPGSLLDGSTSIGATSFSQTTDQLTARSLAESHPGTGESLSVDVSAKYSTDIDGLVDSPDIQYFWDFGDGNTATGLETSHTYTNAGDYEITLTVVNGNESSTSISHISVADPHVLSMDEVIDLSRTQDAVAVTALDDGTEALKFDGTGPLSIGKPSDLFSMSELNLSFSLKPAGEADGVERIFWNHQAYTVETYGDDLRVNIYTDDGNVHKITVPDTNLYDGQWHDIEIAFSSHTGEFNVTIDDEMMGSLEGVTGNINSPGSVDITVGGTLWGKNFDGEISNIDMWTAPEPVLAPIGSSESIQFLPSDESILMEDPSFSLEENISELETTGTTEKTSSNDGYVFNGDGYAVIDKNDALLDQDELVISFDLTADSSDQSARLLWNHLRYGVELNGDDVTFIVFDTNGTRHNIKAPDTSVADGESHNITFSYDTETSQFTGFIDGLEVASKGGIEGPITEPSIWDMTLGGTAWGRNFDGEISDLSVWNNTEVTSMHLEWVRENLNLGIEETPLIVEESSNETVLTDIVVSEEQATDPIIDAITETLEPNMYALDENLSTDSFIGEAQSDGESFTFSGDGYVNLGQPEEISPTDAFTFSFDFSTEIEATSRLAWSHLNFGVEQTGDTLQVRLFTDTGEAHTLKLGESITDGETHNFSMTYTADSGELVAYLDGSEAASTTGITGNINMEERDLTIGGTAWGKEFTGTISNIETSNEVIPPTEQYSQDDTILFNQDTVIIDEFNLEESLVITDADDDALI